MWKTKVVVPYLPNFVEDRHSFSYATNNANAKMNLTRISIYDLTIYI